MLYPNEYKPYVSEERACCGIQHIQSNSIVLLSKSIFTSIRDDEQDSFARSRQYCADRLLRVYSCGFLSSSHTKDNLILPRLLSISFSSFLEIQTYIYSCSLSFLFWCSVFHYKRDALVCYKKSIAAYKANSFDMLPHSIQVFT